MHVSEYVGNLNVLFVIIVAYRVFSNWLQSILRQANFKGAKLLGASFFDADLTGLVIYVVMFIYLTGTF